MQAMQDSFPRGSHSPQRSFECTDERWGGFKKAVAWWVAVVASALDCATYGALPSVIRA